jgi:hypothetical protein
MFELPSAALAEGAARGQRVNGMTLEAPAAVPLRWAGGQRYRDVHRAWLNYGWRDYGVRVGVWRVIDALDRHGVRASVLLNSEVADRYPQIIEAGMRRDWAWLAHGPTNSTLHTGLDPDAELTELTDIVDRIGKATGRRPRVMALALHPFVI